MVDECILPAGRDNWYRSNDWNPEIETAFLRKLSRARCQRDQYLALQISHLASSCPTDCIRLSELYFETRKKDWNDGTVHMAKAQAFGVLGQIDSVLAAYQTALEWQGQHPNHHVRVDLEYPHFVAVSRLIKEYPKATEVLAEAKFLLLPADIYKFHAANAVFSDARGDSAHARDHAMKAVRAQGLKHSGFRYHPVAGLVQNPDERLSKWLNRKVHGGLFAKLTSLWPTAS